MEHVKPFAAYFLWYGSDMWPKYVQITLNRTFPKNFVETARMQKMPHRN